MSTTMIDELTLRLRDLTEEVRILRLTQREMGKELRTLSGIQPIGRDEKLWAKAIECAAYCYTVTCAQIIGRERTAGVARARQFAYWLCVRIAGWSQSHCARVANRVSSNISLALQQHEADVIQLRKHGLASMHDAAISMFRAYLASPEHTGVKQTSQTPQTACATAQ